MQRNINLAPEKIVVVHWDCRVVMLAGRMSTTAVIAPCVTGAYVQSLWVVPLSSWKKRVSPLRWQQHHQRMRTVKIHGGRLHHPLHERGAAAGHRVQLQSCISSSASSSFKPCHRSSNRWYHRGATSSRRRPGGIPVDLLEHRTEKRAQSLEPAEHHRHHQHRKLGPGGEVRDVADATNSISDLVDGVASMNEADDVSGRLKHEVGAPSPLAARPPSVTITDHHLLIMYQPFVFRREGHIVVVTGFSDSGVHVSNRVVAATCDPLHPSVKEHAVRSRCSKRRSRGVADTRGRHEFRRGVEPQNNTFPPPVLFSGMVRKQDVHLHVEIGQRLRAWAVMNPDGQLMVRDGQDEKPKIDMMFAPPGAGRIRVGSDVILQALRKLNHSQRRQKQGGAERVKGPGKRILLPLGDKSPAHVISTALGISKSTFKAAVGYLYRRRLIDIVDGTSVALADSLSPDAGATASGSRKVDKVDKDAWRKFKVTHSYRVPTTVSSAGAGLPAVDSDASAVEKPSEQLRTQHRKQHRKKRWQQRRRG